MFKKKFTPKTGPIGWVPVLLLLAFLSACRTAPLSPVNLSGPGWIVRQGQAVWQPKRSAPEIAGEVLVAIDAGGGRAFIQFTKTPFPLVIAQTTTNVWQIEAPAENRRFSGRGSPPARILWFHLPRAISGSPLPKDWVWRNSGNTWQLENLSTGESLEGYFTP